VVSEPCRSSPDKYWVTIPVVCEWYNDTFGTCSVVLICWLFFPLYATCMEVQLILVLFV